jgi:hypothetical protein
MPEYSYKTYDEIPNWLQCPLCAVYNTQHKTYFLNHFNSCEEYNGHIDDIESYEFDENITIGDFIEQQLNCINTTKKLIRTNELENIQNESYLEITEYIKKKLLENIVEYSDIKNEIIYIYEFFFGETKESKEDFKKLVLDALHNHQNYSSPK